MPISHVHWDGSWTIVNTELSAIIKSLFRICMHISYFDAYFVYLGQLQQFPDVVIVDDIDCFDVDAHNLRSS